MNRHSIKVLASVSLLMTMASPVYAHNALEPSQSFVEGFLHPLQGLDHVLVMFAIGVWACVLSGKMIWILPISCLVMMAVGAVLKFAGLILLPAEQVVLLSVLALGVVLGCNWHTRLTLATGLVALIGLCHGYVHAAQITNGANKLSYALGFLLATAHLQGLGSATVLLGEKTLKVFRIGLGLTCTTAFVVLLAG